MIGKGMPRRGRFATAALGATAVLGIALACEAAPPTEPSAAAGRVEAMDGRSAAERERSEVRAERDNVLRESVARARAGSPDGTTPDRLIQEVETADGPVRMLRVQGERPAGEPIIYVDGIRLSSSATLEELNPDAIERVEVIKGAAAERLFGPQAAAGVIQIFLDGEPAGTAPVRK